MDFHAKNRSQDNVLRIPTDGSAFRYIEEKWPIFKEEPRNVKLSLAADGVNPLESFVLPTQCGMFLL